MERETSFSGEFDGEFRGEFDGEFRGELSGELSGDCGGDCSGDCSGELSGDCGGDLDGWDSVCVFLAGKTWRESNDSWVWMGDREGEIRLEVEDAREAACEFQLEGKPGKRVSENDFSERLRERSRFGTR